MKALKRDLLTGRFWRHFLTYAFACLGAISSGIQALIVFFPSLSSFAGGLAFLSFAGVGALVGLLRAWPRPIQQQYDAPKTSIVIEEGNLLDEPGNVVIGFSNTFDTETPHIIARSSVQGQAQDKFFNNDEKTLDDQIALALRSKLPIGTITKPGKTTLYEIGTVLPIRHGARLLYLLAFCQLNDRNEATATVDGVWKSLSSLWDEVSKTANGQAVAMAVIGGGQSRLSSVLPSQDSIRLIVLSFMFASRKQRTCDQLKIVVHKKDFERLDRMELQSFLDSLRPS